MFKCRILLFVGGHLVDGRIKPREFFPIDGHFSFTIKLALAIDMHFMSTEPIRDSNIIGGANVADDGDDVANAGDRTALDSHIIGGARVADDGDGVANDGASSAAAGDSVLLLKTLQMLETVLQLLENLMLTW